MSFIDARKLNWCECFNSEQMRPQRQLNEGQR